MAKILVFAWVIIVAPLTQTIFLCQWSLYCVFSCTLLRSLLRILLLYFVCPSSPNCSYIKIIKDLDFALVTIYGREIEVGKF